MRRYPYLIASLMILLGGCNLPGGTQPTVVQVTPTSPPPSPTWTATEAAPTVPPTTTSPPPTATSLPPTEQAVESTATPAPTPLPLLAEGEEVTITRITMITPTHGWAIGRQGAGHEHVLYTEDGGKTWQDRTPPTTQQLDLDQNLQIAGFFLDEKMGWITFFLQSPPPPLDPQYVWRTKDAGKTWRKSAPLPLMGMEFYHIPTAMTFTGPDHGWILAHVDSYTSHEVSNLYATQDGGASWDRVHDHNANSLQVARNSGMQFADEKLGWVTKDAPVVAKGPFIEKTTDGGYTWETLFLPSPEEIDFADPDIYCKTYSPTFTSPQTRLLLLSCKDTKGDHHHQYVYATSDRGESWQYSQLPSPVTQLVFPNFQTGYALGRDIYQTKDGGVNWQKIKTVFWDGQFSFVDQQNGWAVAHKKEDIALVRTRDGAESWQIIHAVISP